jgi:hypothetical protein
MHQPWLPAWIFLLTSAAAWEALDARVPYTPSLALGCEQAGDAATLGGIPASPCQLFQDGASGGALKYGDVGRMTETDTPKLVFALDTAV